jgi:hypothetical protein
VVNRRRDNTVSYRTKEKLKFWLLMAFLVLLAVIAVVALWHGISSRFDCWGQGGFVGETGRGGGFICTFPPAQDRVQ